MLTLPFGGSSTTHEGLAFAPDGLRCAAAGSGQLVGWDVDQASAFTAPVRLQKNHFSAFDSTR